MADIKFEIVKMVAVVQDKGDGSWVKELNLVSWNGREPKYDIREWSPDHTKMGKGLILSKEEAKTVAEALLKDLEA